MDMESRHFLAAAAGAENTRTALVSYIVAPFVHGPSPHHQNQLQVLVMARVLAEYGYRVDVVDFDHKSTTKFPNRYDLVIDIHPHDWGFFERVSNPGALRACYITGSNPEFSNPAEKERIESVRRRRGVALAPRRQIAPELMFNREIMHRLDQFIFIGNKTTLDTYKDYDLRNVALVPNTGYEVERVASCAQDRRKFAFIGSSGQVHKGLDLVLEFFASRPDLELFVLSPVQSEPDFCECYRKELFETGNIHALGFVDIFSEPVRRILSECSFFVQPSCSEGMSGSVLTAMSFDLVPVVTPICGFSAEEAVMVAGGTPEDLRRAMEEALSMPAARLRAMVEANRERLRTRYSLQAYKAAFAEAMRRLHSKPTGDAMTPRPVPARRGPAPVAFFTFNRPEETKRVFEAIRAAKPERLFFVSDAARPHVPGEREKVELCRALARQVDWDCEVMTNFASTNMGCGRRIASGIDWVFQHVDRAIVLEDDCLPHATFFDYCAELLERYRDDERVGAISGDNFQRGRKWNGDSYYFSNIVHVWGWATWRRAWKHFDYSMAGWPEFARGGGLERLFPDPPVVAYWRSILDASHQKRIDAWSHQWLYACWKRGMLTALPSENLVSNIGLEGTHVDPGDSSPTLPTVAMVFPMRHPEEIEYLQAADFQTFKTAFKLPCREPESLIGWRSASNPREATPSRTGTPATDPKHVPEVFTPALAREDEYDQAWTWGMSQPHLRDLVRLCYKTPDNAYNAMAFEASDEFRESLRILQSQGQGPGEGRRLLDFGCGNAVATWAFAGHGYETTGIDSSPGNLGGLGAGLRLKGLGGRDFALHISRGEFLPYPDAHFDVVVMRQVLHHITDLPKFLAEVHRVLKPGGIACAFRDHVVWNESQRADFFRTHPFHHITKDENCHYLHEYLEGFRAGGFEEVAALDPFASVINTFPGPCVPGRSLDVEKAKARQEGNDLYSFVARKSTAVAAPDSASETLPSGAKSIVVDGVFFQWARTGIARVWENLLRAWAGTRFGDRIVLLDRDGSAPAIPGIRSIRIQRYAYERFEEDRTALQSICDREGAAAFVSSYYTTPLSTPSVFFAYDMVPEYSGSLDPQATPWPQKHFAIRQAQAFVAISEHTASDLARFHPAARGKTTIALCGLDAGTFHPERPEAVARFREVHGISVPYFLYIGSKINYKNAVLFLEAFSRLADRDRLGIVFSGGETLDEATLSKFVGKAKVVQARLDDQELRAAYAGATALVHPSLYEGFGLPILEAMACGCPVVACRNSSIPEVGGSAILYVETPTAEAMASAMDLVRRPEIRDGLVASGLDRAKRFRWETQADTVRESLTEFADRIRVVADPLEAAMRCLEEASRHVENGRNDEALAALDRADLVDCRDAGVQKAAGNILLRAGQLNHARAKFLQATQLEPSNLDAQMDLAVAWLMLGRLEEAERTLETVIDACATRGDAWKILGQVRLRQQRKAEGVLAYEKALALLPDDPECLSLVGAWKGQNGDVEGARALLGKAAALRPDDNGIRLELSKLSPRSTRVRTGGEASGTPRMTAVVSTYKSAKFMAGCLQDLVDQTLFAQGELEIVVVDSASPENEGDIVRDFQTRHPGIRYIRTLERETLYAAWNRGIRAARGRYVTNANTDDSHRVDALEILADALDANPHADVAFADCWWTTRPNDVWDMPGATRKLIQYYDYHPASSIFWCTLGPHPVWRRTVFEEVGFFDPIFRAAGDLEFQVRFTQARRTAVHVPLALSLFFQNGEGLTFADTTSAGEAAETFRRWRATAPIASLYEVDTSDRKAVAEAWIALGHRSLKFPIPWSSFHAIPDFALECFQKALDSDPGNLHAVFCLTKVAEALGKTIDPPIPVLTQAAIDAPKPPEPPPATLPLRWEPSTASAPVVTNFVTSAFRAAPPAVPPRPAETTRPSGTSTSPTEAPAVRWCGDLFNFSGYARLGREAVAGLMDAGIHVTADPVRNDKSWFTGLEEASTIARWKDLLTRAPEPGLLVCCDLPRDLSGNEPFAQMAEANPGCGRIAGWTMFETDRLPSGWADALNRLDEIWVPSEFNRKTFVESGVRSDRIHRIPGSIDPAPYLEATPMPIPGPAAGFTFLSVFQWSRRKGWDVLLRAWAEAFGPTDDVRLVLKVHPYQSPISDMAAIFEDSLRRLGLSRDRMAPIVVLDGFLPESRMPGLHAAADAFVLPTRGEGWGIPYLEAMASGKPCLATRWGGSLDFLTDENSYLDSGRPTVLVDAEALAENGYLGPDHRWADPDPSEFARMMRHVLAHREEARTKGLRARADVASMWSPGATARAIARRLEDIPSEAILAAPLLPENVSIAIAQTAHGIVGGGPDLDPDSTDSTAVPDEPGPCVSVRWEGSVFVHHSLAQVNRQILLGLALRGHDLSSIPYEPDQFSPEGDPDLEILASLREAPLEAPCQVHVRHQWPPNLVAPTEGRWVVIQPWEFGSPPRDWIPAFSEKVDEIWAYTRHVRDTYIEAGVPAGKIHIVPLGVDCELFHPKAKPHPVKSRKSVKFLYMGGTIARKGFDILLNAWKEAFGPHDDVCLVIKDMGGGTFYKGQTSADWIRSLQDSGACAEIEYIEDDLRPNQIPGLFTACNALVHPYRGEGFGLPIAEAMACGLPVIATRGGASDDFCSDAEGWTIPSRRVPVPGGKVGPFETVADPWWLEPSLEDLVRLLRSVYRDGTGRRLKGMAARNRILSGFTWKHSVKAVENRLRELAAKPRDAVGFVPASSLDRLASKARASIKARSIVASPDSGNRGLDSLNHLLVRAESAAARGDLAEAEVLTGQAIEEHPREPMGWLARAMVLRGLGKLSRSAEAIERSLKERETPEALLEAIQIHLQAGHAGAAKRSEKSLKDRHGAWLRETRELYRSKGQVWPPDALKPTRSPKKTRG